MRRSFVPRGCGFCERTWFVRSFFHGSSHGEKARPRRHIPLPHSDAKDFPEFLSLLRSLFRNVRLAVPNGLKLATAVHRCSRPDREDDETRLSEGRVPSRQGQPHASLERFMASFKAPKEEG